MSQLNVENRSIFCRDNLDILQGINSECIDLIYLDPPFNKNKKFTAPIGSSAEGADFDDIFKKEDLKDEWVQTIKEDQDELYSFLTGIKSVGKTYNYYYLCYMAIRLIECQRLLKSTGILYFHCDPTMSHYLKIMLDCIFGEGNFRNEITWCYTGPSSSKSYFPHKHDVIFCYVKDSKSSYVFNFDDVLIPYDDATLERRKYSETKKGGIQFAGKDVSAYHKGRVPADWWDDIPAGGQISRKELIGYPTQKPKKLLERIIKASSNKGGVVLDPFCGCATTCVAAEGLGRQWIGIDKSIKAYDLVRERLSKEIEFQDTILDNVYNGLVKFSTSPPQRSDTAADARVRKYVYVISNQAYKGEYKVGIASNLNSRLNSYQTADPNRAYKIEYSLRTPHFREIEQHIHDKYDNNHEWVRGDVKKIIKDIGDYGKDG